METTLTARKPGKVRLFLKSFAELYEKLSPHGLVPPQVVDLEESLLGAMMIDKASANRAVQVIGPRDAEDSPFYREAHTAVYLAMLALYEQSPIDLLTVKNQMVKDGTLESVGGPAFLVELTSKVVTTVNIESYARVILEKHTAREAIRICEEIKLRCFEGELDTFSLVDEAAGHFLNLAATQHQASGPKPASKRVVETLKLMEKASQREVPGVSTGFQELDKYTQGFFPGSQTIIAAETGHGKSALACYMGLQAAKRGEGVLIFTSEMKDLEVYLRFIAAESGIPQSQLRGGLRYYGDEQEKDEAWRMAGKVVSQLAGLPIWIDDTPGLNPLQIRARTRSVLAKHPLSIVIVDYLQLLRPTKEKATDAASYASISQELKRLWADLDVAGITLSQLSRTERQYDRNGKALPFRRPHKGRLKESGSIENDANDIYLIYHPRAHEEGYDDEDEVAIELIRDKARSGRPGKKVLIFNRPLQKFYEPPPQFPEFENPKAKQIGAF